MPSAVRSTFRISIVTMGIWNMRKLLNQSGEGWGNSIPSLAAQKKIIAVSVNGIGIHTKRNNYNSWELLKGDIVLLNLPLHLHMLSVIEP